MLLRRTPPRKSAPHLPTPGAPEAAPVALALVVGIVGFLLIRGPGILDPFNIAWLDQNDRAMHTLGWWFFARAPWGWPPGASPYNGLEYANGIALADGLPLFALPFKLIAPLLPPHLQYWGLWQICCFALQALFAALIATRLGLSRPLALVAAMFCVFQPAFLARLDVHMALAGHWTILAAIWLYLAPGPMPRWRWPVLLATIAAIHGYLLLMAGAIWLASLVQRRWLGQARLRILALESVLVLLLVGAVCWAGGIFMASAAGSSGFGEFRLNLLGPFNPDGWSTILPSIPAGYAEWEGFNYLGLGGGLLIVLALCLGGRAWLGLARPRMAPLCAMAVGVALVALSNKVALGNIELIHLPLPDLLEPPAAIFRSSGRLFWPLGYLLIFGSLTILSRRLAATRALALAAACLLVQVVETQSGWRGLMVGPDRSGREWSNPLVAPQWEALAPHYQRIRALPVENGGPWWRDLASFAEFHRMSTDAANLGRADPAALAAAQAAGREALITGALDPGAIYVLGAAEAQAITPHVGPEDFFGTLDGLTVFARGGRAYAARPAAR